MMTLRWLGGKLRRSPGELRQPYIWSNARPAVHAADIGRVQLIELVDEIEALPAARWMKITRNGEGRAPMQQCSPASLAISPRRHSRPWPAVLRGCRQRLVCRAWSVSELNYPMFLLATGIFVKSRASMLSLNFASAN